MKPTQDDCRFEFVEELLNLTERLEAIDRKTPHSTVEPEWWLRMMEMHRQAVNLARQYGNPVSGQENYCGND
jgi:hypothetical protein